MLETVKRRAFRSIVISPITWAPLLACILSTLLLKFPRPLALILAVAYSCLLVVYWQTRWPALIRKHAAQTEEADADERDRLLLRMLHELENRGQKLHARRLKRFLDLKRDIHRRIAANPVASATTDEVEDVVGDLSVAVAARFEQMSNLDKRVQEALGSLTPSELQPMVDEKKANSAKIDLAFEALQKLSGELDEIIARLPGSEPAAGSIDSLVGRLEQETELARRVSERLGNDLEPREDGSTNPPNRPISGGHEA